MARSPFNARALCAGAALLVLATIIETREVTNLWTLIPQTALRAVIGGEGECYVDGSQNCPSVSGKCTATECSLEMGDPPACPAGTLDQENIQKTFKNVAETPSDPGYTEKESLSTINCTKTRPCMTSCAKGESFRFYCVSDTTAEWSQTDSRTPTQANAKSEKCNASM